MLERWARPFSRLSNATARLMDALYRRLGRPGKLVQDFVNGSWLGQALHPVLWRCSRKIVSTIANDTPLPLRYPRHAKWPRRAAAKK